MPCSRRAAWTASGCGSAFWRPASPRAHEAAASDAASNFSESLNGAQPLQDAQESDLRQDTLADEKASPESSEATGGAFGPAPPPQGKSVWFGLLEVRNVGPCREGLPSMYVVRRGEKEIKRGNWDASLAQVRKLIGAPLPPGKLAETRPDGALSWPSLPREQRSSGPELPQVSRHRHKGRRLLTMPFNS